jgi:putative spermidine/putrescine transport system permease protein
MIAAIALRAVSALVMAFLMLPLVVIVGSSLTASQFLSFPPQGYTLVWYAKVLDDPSYVAAFTTSSVLATAATLVAILLAVPAALAIARFEFPGKRGLATLLTSPLVLPHVVLGAALLQYCAALGFMRTFWALLVGHVVIVTPFVLRSVLALLTPEQRVQEEASSDLGARPLSTFFHVTLPQIRSGVVSGAIFAFISSWINVELSIFNTTAGLNTIPVKLFNYVQYTIDPSIAAISAVTILVAAVAIVVLDLTIGLDILRRRR